MDFIERIRDLSNRLPKQLDHIQTEEATKSALVMPFIAALGYNVFDPTEVTPELNADVGIKRGEKVDYAIIRDGQPIILFECKHHQADLSLEHASQLYRYFSVTSARFAVLTNGIVYRFYSDIEEPNKMDSRPFLIFNLMDVTEKDVEELKRFTKSAFNLDEILDVASDLKYTREIKRHMAAQLEEPTPAFVKLFASAVYDGRMTQQVIDQFRGIVQKALRQYIHEQVNDRLKSALGGDVSLSEVLQQSTPPVTGAQTATAEEEQETQDEIETTQEEWEAFYIIRAILREVVRVDRVTMRDVKSYCGILLDDNNRQPLVRLRFNSTQNYLGLFDNDRQEERVKINSLDEIYKYADRIKAAVAHYE